MSHQLINHNCDLKKLRENGYEVDIKEGYLVLQNIPYVNIRKEVNRGTLISDLELSGDITKKPEDHQVQFSGEQPCDKDGELLKRIARSSGRGDLGGGLRGDHSLSVKPTGPEGYDDYFHKMQTYAELISEPAQEIDNNATARTYIAPTGNDEPDSVFEYMDSASTRANIGAITKKLALDRVGIIGVGGSGSYVLDLIAKTPIREIHLFDGDDFLQHNAFRSPGAPSLETLRNRPKKVDYFANLYSPMRKGIIPHAAHIEGKNLYLLDDMDFVFICVDTARVKKPIIEKLEANGISFIDVGMGVYEADGKLAGILRVTASMPDRRDHLPNYGGFSDGEQDDIYAQNIQVADLNALNATLAVIKWKKMYNFYVDHIHELVNAYTIDTNMIANEENI